MKVTIIGAGSAGLATGITLKRRLDADITMFERAAREEAPGLGVALLPFAFNELRMIGLDGFQSYADGFPVGTTTHVFAGWHQEGKPLYQARHQDRQYWGIKRATLLSFLRDHAAREGIDITYNTAAMEDTIRAARESSDLLVGADGAGSLVRNLYVDEFGPQSEDATSRFAWLELEGPLTDFTFGYIGIRDEGLIRITAYPHSSTECSAVVTHSAGLSETLDAEGMLDPDGMLSERALAFLNEVFRDCVGGRKLFGKSRWRRFRATRCGRAASGNVALVGDSFATVHYETGWGTSAALQESRILGHIVELGLGRGQPMGDILELFNRKSLDIGNPLVTETFRVMRAMDAQWDTFRVVRPEEFLSLGTP